MKALLLAAGLGTRLRPLTDDIPKCLVPICGKVLIDHWFELLLSQGVTRILVNTHYFSEAVSRHIETASGPHIDLVHETELLGTGGTVIANADYFNDGSFLVAHADNLTSFSVAAFTSTHQRRPHDVAITMMTVKTPNPSSCGIVEIDDVGVVQQFHEKVCYPVGDLANGAVYIFDQSVLDFLIFSDKRHVDLSTDVIPLFVGRINTFFNETYHRDIGTIESLTMAEQEVKNAEWFNI